jgi:hypothetical protein
MIKSAATNGRDSKSPIHFFSSSKTMATSSFLPPHFDQALGHGAKISPVVAWKVPTELRVQQVGSLHASLGSL